MLIISIYFIALKYCCLFSFSHFFATMYIIYNGSYVELSLCSRYFFLSIRTRNIYFPHTLDSVVITVKYPFVISKSESSAVLSIIYVCHIQINLYIASRTKTLI